MIKKIPDLPSSSWSYVVSFLIFFGGVSPEFSLAAGKDTIAYKLAVLYTKNENPTNVLLNKSIAPAPTTVAEFEWIIDSFKNRCLNPENAIADTIMESWSNANKFLNTKGESISLLQTARELLVITKNTKLFGTEKVNLRMTSRYWLEQKLGRPAK